MQTKHVQEAGAEKTVDLSNSSGLFADISIQTSKQHTGTHKCKCAKCSSQFNGEVIPKRKTLCPVDKHLNEVI